MPGDVFGEGSFCDLLAEGLEDPVEGARTGADFLCDKRVVGIAVEGLAVALAIGEGTWAIVAGDVLGLVTEAVVQGTSAMLEIAASMLHSVVVMAWSEASCTRSCVGLLEMGPQAGGGQSFPACHPCPCRRQRG